jgi:hypothetical protein
MKTAQELRDFHTAGLEEEVTLLIEGAAKKGATSAYSYDPEQCKFIQKNLDRFSRLGYKVTSFLDDDGDVFYQISWAE